MEGQVMPRFNRRTFLQSSTALATGLAMGGTLTRDKELFQLVGAAEGAQDTRKLVPTQCPYCGVGCHTYYVVENEKIVACIPDKDSPVNLGLQCIKGLTAAESLYVDRLDKVLIRKDMSNPLTGRVSKTKGRFDDDVFRVGTWEEGMDIVSNMVVGIVKKHGGNSVGIYQSGQLTMEEQWLDNILYKGVLQSNTIEANARMCMTSAVTGYIHSLGSDHPPGNYSDIEDADFINHWGHNARGSQPRPLLARGRHQGKAEHPDHGGRPALYRDHGRLRPGQSQQQPLDHPSPPTAISPFRTPSPTS